jgi:hypothetical protein
MKKFTIEEIRNFAENLNAVEFEAFCDKAKIHTSWLDIDNLMNYNEGYYNVELRDYDLFVSYYDGVLEEFTKLELQYN